MSRLPRSALIPRSLAIAAALFPALSCGGSDGQNNGQEANLQPPAECALGQPPDDFTYPTGPYGGAVGETFEDITLDDCDGNSVVFGDVLAQSELAMFNIGAGWCDPCIEETKTLDKEIFRAFCARGLRVVQVLFQDDQSRSATKLFCQQWREQFSLSFPVLIDPVFETEKYFEEVSAQTPINFLIDPAGKIVYKDTGEPSGDLPTTIDGLLPP